MKNARAGEFDRRISIYEAVGGKDDAGDEIPEYRFAFKLWARKVEGGAGEKYGAHETIRENRAEFLVRFNNRSRLIAGETHRIGYDDRIWEILSVKEGKSRKDTRLIQCAYRPDLRGSRAKGADPDGP